MTLSKEKLEQLHEVLAQELLARIQQGEAAPALLNVARQFLRDNGIESLYQFQKLLMHLEVWRLFPGSSSRALVRGRGDSGL